MLRLRVPGRFLRPCSVSPCSVQTTRTPSSPDPSSSEKITSTLAVQNRRFLRPRIFPSDPTVAAAPPPPPQDVPLFPPSFNQACSSVRAIASEAHHDPVKPTLSKGSPSRCFHWVCSRKMSSEHDRIDGQLGNSSQTDRESSVDGAQVDGEDIIFRSHISDGQSLEDGAQVEGEEFFTRPNISECSSCIGNSTRCDEAEEIPELYSASTTSTDESDLSELDVEAEVVTEFRSASQTISDEFDLSELEFEAEVRSASTTSRDESDLSELEFTEEVGRMQEGSGEKVLKASDPDEERNHGRPFLHTLSVDEVREILEKARARDVRILQVRESCEWVDQMVFASGRSSRHLRGMADALVYKVKQSSQNVGPNSFPTVEGRDGEQWMAVDCGSIVVHLFLEDARSYYNLEEFWGKKSNPRLA